MLRNNINTILLDLDGTLLPMETQRFTNTYFQLLAQKAAPFGYEAKSLVAAVWKGTKAMIQNDGSMKNDARFWRVFAGELGEQVLEMRPVFDSFYANEFHGARSAVEENPLAKIAVDSLKAKGYRVALATNPLFPAVGVATRLNWLGLRPQDFTLVTSYEGCSYCKPNPLYFQEVLRNLSARPEECLMVGNDALEDAVAAGQAGIEAYLITNCLEHEEYVEASGAQMGSFQEFLKFAGVE